MRSVLISIILLMAPTSSLFAQTQFELNQSAGNDFQKADKKLNSLYKQILGKYSKNALFIKNLKSAQRLWVQFRDAQLAMRYPVRKQGHYGSVLPMCESIHLAGLTNDRIKQLQEWVKPEEEGDVCLGSVGEFEAE